MDDGRGGRQGKPKAYVGTEPYLFVSYSHKDENIIYPLIRKMQQLNCADRYVESEKRHFVIVHNSGQLSCRMHWNKSSQAPLKDAVHWYRSFYPTG